MLRLRIAVTFDSLVLANNLSLLEVPQKLRGMIENQIDALSQEEQRALEAASVEGQTFSARVCAEAANLDPDVFEELCERLSRREHIVESAEPQKLPDGTLFYAGSAGVRTECPNRSRRTSSGASERFHFECSIHCPLRSIGRFLYEATKDRKAAEHHREISREIIMRLADSLRERRVSSEHLPFSAASHQSSGIKE